MTGKCRFCGCTIHPEILTPLNAPPNVNLAALPIDRRIVIGLGIAGAKHMAQAHPSYVNFAQAVGGTMTGHVLILAISVDSQPFLDDQNKQRDELRRLLSDEPIEFPADFTATPVKHPAQA